MRLAAGLVLALALAALVARADPPRTAVGTYNLYGASYSEPAFTEAAGKALEQRVAELERQVAVLSGGAVAAKAPRVDVLPLAVRYCSACHVPGEARGGFVLFATDDATSLAALTEAQRAKVRQLVADGSMPKRGAKMTAAEKALWERWR